MRRLIMKTGKEIACLGYECMPFSLFKYGRLEMGVFSSLHILPRRLINFYPQLRDLNFPSPLHL